jgi:hypothetical protein
MFYPASDTIASDHPDLTDSIRSVDAYLSELKGQLLRVEPAADILGVELGLLERLLRLYQVHGVVERVELFICPEDDEILSFGEEGLFWCDICETEYHLEDCESETAYQPQLAALTAPAPGQPRFPKGYALLLGVGAYRNLPALGKTTADARDLYAVLTDPVYAGYAPRNVRLLLDEEVTKANVNDALDRMARGAGSEDTVVIFFSGHGVQRIGGFEPGEYLCPVEADWSDLRATAISTGEFTTALRAIGAGRIVVLLDACHSGGVGEPKGAAFQSKAGLSDNAYNRLAQGRGRVIIASCRPDEVSWELAEMENGLFTHFLLEGMRGAAASDDGTVRVLDLFTFVSAQVPTRAEQHPLLKGELEDNFPIVLAPNKR